MFEGICCVHPLPPGVFRRQNMEHDDEGVALFRLSNCRGPPGENVVFCFTGDAPFCLVSSPPFRSRFGPNVFLFLANGVAKQVPSKSQVQENVKCPPYSPPVVLRIGSGRWRCQRTPALSPTPPSAICWPARLRRSPRPWPLGHVFCMPPRSARHSRNFRTNRQNLGNLFFFE